MSAVTRTALPPGPGACDLRAIRDDPLRFLTETVAAYGDVVCYTAGGETGYLINRPELARQVLKDNAANYTKQATPDFLMLRPLLGNGLLTSEGNDWARQRHMCAPAFRRSQVENFDSVMTSAAQGLIERWRPAMAAGHSRAGGSRPDRAYPPGCHRGDVRHRPRGHRRGVRAGGRRG